MNITMQHDAHAELLKMTEELHVIDLLGTGDGVMPDCDSQQPFAKWQLGSLPRVLLLPLRLPDEVRHGVRMHAGPLSVRLVDLPARVQREKLDSRFPERNHHTLRLIFRWVGPLEKLMVKGVGECLEAQWVLIGAR
jgi:hypothetical protein